MQPDIIFKSANVTPISTSTVTVEWSIYLNMEDPALFRFRVFRSGSDDGPWEVLGDNLPLSAISFQDNTVKIVSKLRGFCWKVEAYKTDNTWSTSSKVLTVEHAYDKVALAIIDKANLILRNKYKGVGVRCRLYVLKTSGPRCPVCWDATKMKMKLSNCPKCYGTGYVNGYYYPSEIYINLTSASYNVRQADISMTESAIKTAWALPAPKISPNDIIIDLDTNERYRVTNQGEVHKRGACLRQQLQMTMLKKGSIEYNLA